MPDTPVEGRADGPYDPDPRARASRLESDVYDVTALIRLNLLATEINTTLDAPLPLLVTGAALAERPAEPCAVPARGLAALAIHR